MQTYNTNSMVTDSAPSASAIFSGVKTNQDTLGFDNSIVYGDVMSMLRAKKVSTVLDWAQEADMVTGFVTTTRLTHATPAALYAKTANRNWECRGGDMEEDLGENMGMVDDIATQMIESDVGRKARIILGGGRGSFTPTSKRRYNYSDDDWNCTTSRVDLVETWQEHHPQGRFIENRTDLLELNNTEYDSVLGIFANSHLPYDDMINATNEVPSIKQMTQTAVQFLQEKAGETGFFLMVEAGRIDHAHHTGRAVRSLNELLAMDEAVQAVLDLTDPDDTLIIVTADHAHTMSISGYSDRAANITGVVTRSGKATLADDDEPYSILTYANGPGFSHFTVEKNIHTGSNWTSIRRNDLAAGDLADFSTEQASAVPLESETHGGDDVGIWAIGPMAHLFHGLHEQSYIAHVASFAACIGPHRTKGDRCKNMHERSAVSKVSISLSLIFPSFVLFFILH